MIYDSGNTWGATVHDIATRQRIDDVLRIDTSAATVICADRPLRDDGTGHVATHALRFDAVHPIFGGERRPVMFHCYGRHGG